MATFIDLHLHTTFSDGHWQPSALFEKLAESGINVAAVMDHDQMEHLPQMQALGKEHGITVIPGTEITAHWRSTAAHILCYAPPATGFTSDALRNVADGIRHAMITNTDLIYRTLLARGYTFVRQDKPLGSHLARAPQRAGDIMQLLYESGYATTQAEALRLVTEAGYRQATAPLAAVVEATHASGGVCVLAHPGRGEGEIHRYETDEIEDVIRDVPLDGIEVYYPLHSPEQVETYAALAERHGLLMSTGSDSHGPQHRMPIAYPANQAATLLERLGVAHDK
jgi:predicted metal-dependent phosphoesterase TrpH